MTLPLIILPVLGFAFLFLGALYFQRGRQWGSWTVFGREQRFCYCIASICGIVGLHLLFFWTWLLRGEHPQDGPPRAARVHSVSIGSHAEH